MFRSLLLGVALGAPNALNEANDLRSIMERGMSNAGKEQTAKETAVAAPRLSVVDMEKQQEKQRADVEAELAEAQKMKDMFSGRGAKKVQAEVSEEEKERRAAAFFASMKQGTFGKHSVKDVPDVVQNLRGAAKPEYRMPAMPEMASAASDDMSDILGDDDAKNANAKWAAVDKLMHKRPHFS